MLNQTSRFLVRGVLVAMASLCLALGALAITVQAGPYKLDVVTDPAVIPVGRANFVISVTDAGGKPVTDATVKAIAKMPGMSMGEKEMTARTGDKPGTYVVPAVFSMGGLYDATITVEGPAGKGVGNLQISTGQSTQGANGPPDFLRVALISLAVGLAIVILLQMRRTGQKINVRSFFSVSVLGSLLLLAGAVALAFWLIKTQRRPGAMTPIEAQAMEMNTPAPEGVLPVVLATVESKSFAPSVRYSGQAVGFSEQDIVPRTTGVIVEMPVYVGDRVKKGQLLARLDTTQLDPEVDMRTAALGRSQQGVEVAAIEYQAALSEVSTARAEMTVAQGEAREAQAMLGAAREGKEGAAADIAIAEAEISNARAALESATANQTYAQAEVERQQALADKGFISKREAQRARADADQANAAVRQAEQDVQKALSALRSAQSAQRRTDAEIEAARVKVETAKANTKAKEATMRQAQRMADAAKARVSLERASVKESSAGLRGAATQQGYAVLRAEGDGVVVQRLIAPGQVVSPGQALLRVARTSPIRLQANVPEADLARIRVGASATVSLQGDATKEVRMRVTSVSPSVDTGARMGLVEAIYENKDERFLPGQYISMSIEIGESKKALVIPTAAIVRRNQKASVWLAEGTGTELTLKRQEVQLGEESGEMVSVLDGVESGQKVVVDPGPDLRGGLQVVEAEGDDAVDDGLTVLVTEQGYDPPSVTIPANKPVTLTFIRKTEATCGNEIIFPDLKINKPLPMNTPIKVEIPARPAGSLRFTCGMDMLEGKLVIQ